MSSENAMEISIIYLFRSRYKTQPDGWVFIIFFAGVLT
jgi:hypothetical protein